MTSPSAPSVLARTSIGESECVRLSSETCQTPLRMTVLRLVIAYSTFFHSSQSANNDQPRGTALEGQRSSQMRGRATQSRLRGCLPSKSLVPSTSRKQSRQRQVWRLGSASRSSLCAWIGAAYLSKQHPRPHTRRANSFVLGENRFHQYAMDSHS